MAPPPSDEQILETFQNALIRFKKSYIESLEEQTEKGGSDEEAITTDDLQINERIQGVLDRLDELYGILETMILQGKNTNPDLDAQAVASIFQKNGVIDSIQQNMELRKKLLEVLRQELKLYPFTVDRGLMRSFVKSGLESHQREIVQN